MNSTNLSKPNDELVEKFIAIALQQYEALESFQISKFSRLYPRLKAIELELKARPGDQRGVLVKLYRHENIHVRLRAAFATLALQPIRSREVLREIKETKITPYSADAWGMLNALDDGSYVPI